LNGKGYFLKGGGKREDQRVKNEHFTGRMGLGAEQFQD
jgi:hypothetical protein